MADVKNYLKEKEKRNKNQNTYQSKIRKHKLNYFYRIILIIVLVIAVFTFIYFQFKNHIYTQFDVITSIEKETVTGAQTLALGNNIVTYSNDGAHCTDAKGNILWNQTFEMQDIMLAQSGDIIAIADYNGRDIYIMNSSKKLGEVNTTMPIRHLAVSSNGRVAVSIADTKVTWLYIYDSNGNREFDIRTTMNQSGYPISFSLSPNGELLGISYVFVDAGVIKSRVAFYNFGSVGANQSDYYVSGYTYPDSIISYISFMNNETACAIGDDRLIFFSGNQIPTLQTQYMFEDEIQSVYNNENHLGLVFRSDLLEQQYRIEVYKSNSNKIGNYYFDIDIKDIIFNQDHFVIYNNKECYIKTFSNVVKFEGELNKTVNLLLPYGKKGYKYIVVTNDSIDTIQLK